MLLKCGNATGDGFHGVFRNLGICILSIDKKDIGEST